MLAGFSINFLNVLSHLAPTAPSTTRWSHDKVTVINVATLWPSFSSGTTLFSEPPTAKMQDCGGLMTALKLLMPNMPKLETVKVPPWNSWGCSLLLRAFCARLLTSKLMLDKPFLSALNTIGVMRPFSVATATHTSTLLYFLIKVSIQAELASGTFFAGQCRRFDHQIIKRYFNVIAC